MQPQEEKEPVLDTVLDDYDDEDDDDRWLPAAVGARDRKHAVRGSRKRLGL